MVKFDTKILGFDLIVWSLEKVKLIEKPRIDNRMLNEPQ